MLLSQGGATNAPLNRVAQPAHARRRKRDAHRRRRARPTASIHSSQINFLKRVWPVGRV